MHIYYIKPYSFNQHAPGHQQEGEVLVHLSDLDRPLEVLCEVSAFPLSSASVSATFRECRDADCAALSSVGRTLPAPETLATDGASREVLALDLSEQVRGRKSGVVTCSACADKVGKI